MVQSLRLLIACALVLWATTAQAQIVCEDANFDSTGSQVSATPTVTIPTNIASGDLLILGIAERDGGGSGVPTGIAGSVSGTWTVGSPISTSSGTGGDTRWYYLVSSAAGADTITVTYSGSKVSRLMAGRCTVTGGAPELDVFDATPATGSSTSVTSDSVTPTADGIALGFLALSGDQDITAVGTSETDVTNETSTAAHLVSQAASNGVGVSIGAVTIDGSRDWAAHIAVFKQAGGGGGGGTCTGGLLLLGAGKC